MNNCKKKEPTPLPSWDCTPAYFATNSLRFRRLLFAKPAGNSKRSRPYIPKRFYFRRMVLVAVGLYAIKHRDVSQRGRSEIARPASPLLSTPSSPHNRLLGLRLLALPSGYLRKAEWAGLPFSQKGRADIYSGSDANQRAIRPDDGQVMQSMLQHHRVGAQ